MVKVPLLHACDQCRRGYTSKKALVKHIKDVHYVEKNKKSSTRNRLVHCPIEGCSLKSKTGGFSYHKKVHH